MAYAHFERVYQHTCQWVHSLQQTGWVAPDIAQQLQSLSQTLPEHLFQDTQARPLIVAFMGGTGVGKSSLLNRLAGKAIAKVGEERPTSKEVTLYHHESVNLSELPAHLPLDKIRIAKHTELDQQQLVWIDMPDFDSIEQQNQQLVLQWLPYIDVLIYVVSPERYRDNKAWQMLMQEGQRHAWIFILNQWDKGCTEQYLDFKRQLQLAKFDNPMIYKTDCSGVLPDEYLQLQDNLRTLANQNTLVHLEQRGEQLRYQALAKVLQSIQTALGTAAQSTQLQEEWQPLWQHASEVYRAAFVWITKLHSEYYAQTDGQVGKLPAHSPQEFWDQWAQQRLHDLLDEIILRADALNLPTQHLKTELQTVRQKAGKWMAEALEIELRKALANPGNSVQRSLLKLAQFFEIVLPLSAMGTVAYTVLQGYYQSNQTHTHYLGLDFAIHSVLVIALAWIIPFFMRLKLKPSLKSAALRGLKIGLEQGLAQIDSTVNHILLQTQQLQHSHLQQVQELLNSCQTQTPVTPLADDSALARMLMPQSAATNNKLQDIA